MEKHKNMTYSHEKEGRIDNGQVSEEAEGGETLSRGERINLRYSKRRIFNPMKSRGRNTDNN